MFRRLSGYLPYVDESEALMYEEVRDRHGRVYLIILRDRFGNRLVYGR